jgi:hypothetical protein
MKFDALTLKNWKIHHGRIEPQPGQCGDNFKFRSVISVRSIG